VQERELLPWAILRESSVSMSTFPGSPVSAFDWSWGASRLELVADAEEKLALLPRLRDVVVRVELEPVDPILEGGFRGEEDDGMRDVSGVDLS